MGIILFIILIAGLMFFAYQFMQMLIKLGELSKIQRALFILDEKDSEDLMKKFKIQNKDIYTELVADSFRAVQQAKRNGSISLEKEVTREGDIREL